MLLDFSLYPKIENVLTIGEGMKKFLLNTVLLGVLVGCSSYHPRTSNEESQNKHQFKPMWADPYSKNRTPAENILTSVDFSVFDTRKPNTFEVYVYPKISAQTFKHAGSEVFDKGYLLGKPQTFQVSVIANLPCKRFVEDKSNLFKKYNVKEIFDKNLESTEKKCAILEMTSLKMKKANADLIRRGDILKYRVFIDNEWKTYGYEIDELTGQVKNTVTRKIKFDSQYSGSSGLSMFPIDLPILSQNDEAEPAEKVGDLSAEIKKIEGFDDFALHQLAEEKRNFKLQSCKGVKLKYRDYYGQSVEVGVCDRSPWPDYINNSRFVAITQNFNN